MPRRWKDVQHAAAGHCAPGAGIAQHEAVAAQGQGLAFEQDLDQRDRARHGFGDVEQGNAAHDVVGAEMDVYRLQVLERRLSRRHPQFALEAAARQGQRRVDQPHAACDVALPEVAAQRQGAAFAGLARLRGAVLYVQAAHPGFEAGGHDHHRIASADSSRMRDAGARRTVAGGRVLDIFPPARHKRGAERLALLAAMRDDDPLPTLALLAAQSLAGVDLDRFALAWNLDAAAAPALWLRAGLRQVRDGELLLGYAEANWKQLEQRLLDALAREHERAPDLVGVERERLRRMTSANLPRPAFAALVDELLAPGRIATTRAWLHLPQHVASVSAADRDLFTVLKPLLDAAPFNPPRVRDVFRASGTPEETVRQLFRRMARGGELYPVAQDHYFTARAVADLAAIVARLATEHGAARAADLRNVIYADGSGGRKVAIQILEFFDRIGYTRRVRDTHVLRGTPEQFGS